MVTREPYGLGFNSITEENTFAVRLSIRWALENLMVLVLILSQRKTFCCMTQYQVVTREPYGPGFKSITEENTFAVRLSIRWALENLMVLVLILSQRKTLCCKTQYQVVTREPYGLGFNSITEETLLL